MTDGDGDDDDIVCLDVVAAYEHAVMRTTITMITMMTLMTSATTTSYGQQTVPCLFCNSVSLLSVLRSGIEDSRAVVARIIGVPALGSAPEPYAVRRPLTAEATCGGAPIVGRLGISMST